MPITDSQALNVPVDETGEVLTLTPGSAATITVAVESTTAAFDVVLQVRQKGGEWFEAADFSSEGDTFTQTTQVSAGESRIIISKTNAGEGETGDFYMAAGR